MIDSCAFIFSILSPLKSKVGFSNYHAVSLSTHLNFSTSWHRCNWGGGGQQGMPLLYFYQLRLVFFLLSCIFKYPCSMPHAVLLAKLGLCQLAYFHETLCVPYALGGHLIAVHFNFLLSLITTWLASQDCASRRIWNKMSVM
jgi:hypothetical protein